MRCENCNKSLKNSIILQYHQLHCTPTQAHKSEKKNTSSSSTSLASPAVEKKIIDSKRSNASPVDMILKKLTEKVHSSSTSSSTLSSPVTSPGSNYKFFKSKAGDEKSAESVKEDEEDEASKKMKDHIKSCRDKQISVSMKKISHSEIDITPSTGKSKSPSKSATKSSSSLEATESPSATKKPEKKETTKASPLKASSPKSSKKIAKPKEVVAKLETAPKKNPVGRPAVKKSTTGKKKVVSSDSDSNGKSKKKRKSYTKDSSSDEDSEFEARTRKRTPTLYCFESCFEEESNEMIG